MLIIVLSIPHQISVPDKIPVINKTVVCISLFSSTRPSPAKTAPKNINVNGLEIVNKNVETKSPSRFCLLRFCFFICLIGFEKKMRSPRYNKKILPIIRKCACCFVRKFEIIVNPNPVIIA